MLEPSQNVITSLTKALTREFQPSHQQLRSIDTYLARQIELKSGSCPVDVASNADQALHYTSLDSQIHVTLCGEHITYDLNTLEPEPQGIITLLKLTMSERGAWMVVAAYYRRKKLISAAIAVMTSMLDGNLSLEF
jgi:hypothetical protein